MSEWTPGDSIPASTTKAEKYRLCDPYVCIVCGQGIEYPMHLCTQHGKFPDIDFGGRFTWRATEAYMSRLTAYLASRLRVSFNHAREYYVENWHPGGVFDYTEDALAFWGRLSKLFDEPPLDHGEEVCVDVSQIGLEFLGARTVTVDDLSVIDCTLCSFDLTRAVLSSQEDKRHGIPIGYTNKEYHRIGRARLVEKKAAEVANMDIGAIVGIAMGE